MRNMEYTTTNGLVEALSTEPVKTPRQVNLTRTEQIVLIAFIATLSLFGTISNTIIMIVYNKKRTQYASLYLLFVLASVDLVVSALVMPFTILTYLPLFRKANLLCGLGYFARYSTSAISVCLLGLIAVERFHTITSRTLTSLNNVQLTLIRNSRIASMVAVILCLAFGTGCFFIYENKDDTLGCVERDPTQSKIYNYTVICSLMLILVAMVILYIKTYVIVKQSRNKIFDMKNAASNRSNKVINLTSTKIDVTLTRPAAAPVTTAKVDDKIVVSAIENTGSMLKVNEVLMNRSHAQRSSLTEIEQPSTTITTNNQRTNNLILKIISNNYFKDSNSTNLPLQVYEYQTEESIEMPSMHPIHRQITKQLHRDIDQSKISNFDTFSQFFDSKLSQPPTDQSSEATTIKPSNQNDTLSSKLARFYSKVFAKSSLEASTNTPKPKEAREERPTETIKIFAPRRSIGLKKASQFNSTNMSIRKDWRVARMFVLVTVTFVITWIPYCLISLGLIAYNPVVINTYFLNTAANPIIYSFLSRSFRKEAKQMLFSLCKKKQSSVKNNTNKK